MKSTNEVNGYLKAELESLRKKMGAINVVGASGPIDAKLMFIGEAPGKDEDEQDMPFVGRSGDLLNKLLKDTGLDRDGIYITNVVKCRPTTPDGKANRAPTEDEVEVCKKYLWKEMSIVRPKLIVTLGLVPTRLIQLGKKSMVMASAAGNIRPLSYLPGTSTCAVWHPSFLLRTGNEYIEKTQGVFKHIKEYMDERR